MASICSTCSIWTILLLLVGKGTALTWSGTDMRSSPNCDFYGADFKNQISSSSQCASLCKTNAPCNHFTWTDYLGGTCWMKVAVVSEFDAVSKFDQGAICGFLKSANAQPSPSSWIDAGNFIWAKQCDFFNRDFMNVSGSSPDFCGPTCLSNPQCSHFTWTDYQGGTCWLKKGGASECSAFIKTDSNAVCGFLKF